MSYRNFLFAGSGRGFTVALFTVTLGLSGCAQDQADGEPAVGGNSGGAEAAAEAAPNAAATDGAAAPANAETGAAAPAAPAAPAAALIDWPIPGKYGCSESISRMVNGSFEFTPEGRGYLTVDGRGGYVDPYGVQGSYRSEGSQESRFTGGALDNAVVTPLEGDEPRLWVVIPTESGERRWSCTLTDE